MIAHDRRIAENTASDYKYGNTFQWSGDDPTLQWFQRSGDRQRLYGNTFQRSGDRERSYASVILAIRRSWAIICKLGLRVWFSQRICGAFETFFLTPSWIVTSQITEWRAKQTRRCYNHSGFTCMFIVITGFPRGLKSLIFEFALKTS